jgi:DNA-binding NarL/FixJ family response regulator
MIDWDTHRIIDMIPSRDTNTVSQWLSTYPNIEMISRDGASGYASASAKAHPNAIQVTDRFHLLKNLSEVVDRYIKNTFPSRVEIAASADVSEEMKCLYDTANRAQRIRYAHTKRKEGLTIQEIAYLLHSGCKTVEKYLAIPENEIPEDRHILRERQHQEAVKHKEEEINRIRQMYNGGMCIAEIARATHHTPKTVKDYLDPNYSAVSGHYDRKRCGKMTPYEKEIIEMRAAGKTYTEVFDVIKLKGYSGTVAAIRMYMQKERVHAKSTKCAELKDFVHRITLTQLVYHKLEEVKLITKGQYEALLKQYPELAGLYALIKEFHEILFSKKADSLDEWIKKASSFAIPELQTFLGGLSQDCEAVRNAILYDYNNGLAEGSVTKIKLIKRIMYGRNSFHLLKSKVLLHELLYVNTNQ